MIECFLAQEWEIFKEDETIYNMEGDTDMEERTVRHLDQHNTRYHHAVMSLACLHRESRKKRPMSCAPHTVNLETNYHTL